MACFQGYVSFREGISTVLLDFDDWYGCYSRDIDNKLEVLFLFFSFLFLSSKSSLDFWHGLKHGGPLVCFGFPPFLAVFLPLQTVFLGSIHSFGSGTFTWNTSLFVEAMFYFVVISFQQKGDTNGWHLHPTLKKRTDKRFTWNMFFFAWKAFSFLVV